MFISRRGYPYRDESTRMRERFFRLFVSFPVNSLFLFFFFPIVSLFLSLSFTLAAHRATLTFLLLTIETAVGARRLARSLARTVHSPTPISPFVAIVAHERHPRSQDQIFADAPSTGDFLVFPVHTNARSRTAHPGRMHGRRIPIRQ